MKLAPDQQRFARNAC